MSQFPYVQIAVSLPLDGLYTYVVPKGMSLEVGHAVLVPFGKQKVSGYVIEFLEDTPLTKVRSVSRILDPTPAFDRDSIPFFQMDCELLSQWFG